MENTKRITALHLATEVVKENQPIDYNWLHKTVKRYSGKEKRDWARDNIYCSLSCPQNASKQLIGRAATELLNLLHL